MLKKYIFHKLTNFYNIEKPAVLVFDHGRLAGRIAGRLAGRLAGQFQPQSANLALRTQSLIRFLVESFWGTIWTKTVV